MNEEQDDAWWTFLIPKDFGDFAQIILILAVMLSLVSQANLYRNAEADQDARNVVVACQNEVSRATIAALEDRSRYTNQVNDAIEELLVQQRDTLVLIITPGVDQEEVGLSIQAYAEATQKYLTLSQKAKETRDEFPLPTEEDYIKCSEG